MATRIDDRYLWLGVGALAFVVVKGVQYAMADLTILTKIDPYQYEPKSNKSAYPEDDLSLETLQRLSESNNTNISNSAISLVLGRLSRMPQIVQMITDDLASSDPVIQQRSQTAFRFLRYHSSVSLDHNLLSPPGYQSPTAWSEGLRTPSEFSLDLGESSRNPEESPEVAGTIVPSIDNPVAGWEDVPRARSQQRRLSEAGSDEIEAEFERRRRRREAVVVHEGAGAITGRDIFNQGSSIDAFESPWSAMRNAHDH